MIKGDIHTHTYHNHPGGIVDSSGRVIQDVLDARKRGVLFDVGHGAGVLNTRNILLLIDKELMQIDFTSTFCFVYFNLTQRNKVLVNISCRIATVHPRQ